MLDAWFLARASPSRSLGTSCNDLKENENGEQVIPAPSRCCPAPVVLTTKLLTTTSRSAKKKSARGVTNHGHGWPRLHATFRHAAASETAAHSQTARCSAAPVSWSALRLPFALHIISFAVANTGR
jgi:hypothetical protein